MLIKRTFETLKKLGNERLQLPIFYESPVALRFEIGDPTMETLLDGLHPNPRYLKSAQWRASFLYEKTAPFDTLLWVLYRTGEETETVPELLERFCRLAHLPNPMEVYQQETTDADGDPLTRILLFWDLAETPLKVTPLLAAIMEADFGGFRELSSAVFFFDTTRHLLFHPYDDRGADVVGETAEALRFLYEDCQNWLLTYDLERMRRIFA